MKRFALLILTAFIAIGISHCTDDSAIPTPPGPDPETCVAGDTVRVFIGEQFEISLYNAGFDGGYYWKFVDEFSDRIIEYIDHRTELVNPGLFGSPVYDIWTYKSKAAGMTCATLELKRPWLEDEPPIETKNIVVIVE